MTDVTMRPAEILAMLPHFPGTEHYYQHSLGMKYTDGVHFLAEKCQAFWLLDALAGYQGAAKKNTRLREFQLWELTVDPESKRAMLTCRENAECPAEFVMVIPYIDFPLNYVKLYVEGKVILLPAEY